MNLVSLLVLPAIISFEVDDEAARFVVAGIALIVLAGAVVWSSRKSAGMLAANPAQIHAPPVGTLDTLMLSSLSEWVTDVIDRLGYVGVALLIALENLFPPIPSEIVLPFAGFVASDGDANLIGMIVAATIGSLVGAWILYGIARWIGERRLRVFITRYGKWLRLTNDDIDKADRWFEHRRASSPCSSDGASR